MATTIRNFAAGALFTTTIFIAALLFLSRFGDPDFISNLSPQLEATWEAIKDAPWQSVAWVSVLLALWAIAVGNYIGAGLLKLIAIGLFSFPVIQEWRAGGTIADISEMYNLYNIFGFAIIMLVGVASMFFSSTARAIMAIPLTVLAIYFFWVLMVHQDEAPEILDRQREALSNADLAEVAGDTAGGVVSAVSGWLDGGDEYEVYDVTSASVSVRVDRPGSCDLVFSRQTGETILVRYNGRGRWKPWTSGHPVPEAESRSQYAEFKLSGTDPETIRVRLC